MLTQLHLLQSRSIIKLATKSRLGSRTLTGLIPTDRCESMHSYFLYQFYYTEVNSSICVHISIKNHNDTVTEMEMLSVSQLLHITQKDKLLNTKPGLSQTVFSCGMQSEDLEINWSSSKVVGFCFNIRKISYLSIFVSLENV